MNRSRYPRPLRYKSARYLPTCRGWRFPWGEFAAEAFTDTCPACGLLKDRCECQQTAAPIQMQTDRTAPIAA